MSFENAKVHMNGPDELVLESGATLTVKSGAAVNMDSGSTLSAAADQAFTGTQTFDDIAGNASTLSITGKASTAATGGGVAIAGGATTTSGVGGLASLTGGAGSGTDAGGVASMVGGASGAGLTGNGGNAAVTGGAAASTNGSGGSVVLAGGAKAGTGIAGGIFGRSNRFQKYAAPAAGADQNEAVTAAQMINGIFVHTISTGRTLTTPTGAAISAGCPAELAVGDSFLFHVITIGTGADDIATLTAGDGGVTFVGKVTIGPDTAAIAGYATFLFRNTGTNTWVGYRIG
jgi:hypothetical protein